ncbi:RES family NAD+ phosphorylase [Mesorhizobium sp. M0208]|uniref:RES family NAD+ phosphorylase n=1 Tax=Mesorhizobium sp. M0208 TaxID=2956916 RepID=UPI0033360329
MYPQIAVHGQYRRLIPSKYPTIDIYERFGSPEMRAFAAELEKVTNPRLAAKSRLTGGDISADSGSPRLQNWNHAPFAYPMPEGTYMLPGPYSVMELAGDERGALARAIVRREEFLARTEEPACGVDMRMITNRVLGTFVDLRGLPPDTPGSARQKLGRHLYEEGAQGVVFGMTELPGHDFVSIFTSDALPDKGIQGAHYRFRWDGTQIHRIYSFGENRDIDRSDIIPIRRVAA